MDVTVSIFFWWLTFFLGGLAVLPLCAKLFPNTVDRGYPFAKILGLLILAYPVWLLGSFRLVPFAPTPVWLLLTPPIFIIIISVRLLNNWAGPARKISLIIFEELIFSFAFFFWLFVRSHEPSLQSLEKPMDFGIINSLLRADYFPPKDMWLAGYSLNYYYFGHLVAAVLIKITGVLPAIGYNLMLATLFALTFTAAFSFGLNLFWSKKGVIFGLLTAITLTLFGNLHPIFAFLNGFGSYWYPDATRFIPRTIHEFPLYSFVVADLHAHVLDIPFVLLTLFLLRQIWLTPTKALIATLGFLLGILYMVNSLDAAIYFALFTLLLSGAYWTKNWSFLKLRDVTFWFNTLEYYTKQLLPVAVIIIITSLPFLLSFKPFVGGVGLAPERSPLWQLFILWGGFLTIGLGFLLYSRKKDTDLFITCLIIFSIFLLIVPEIIYFRDIYTTQPRANTMFKVTYQAFIILSLATPYAACRLCHLSRSLVARLFWVVIYGAILIITSSYPFFAIRGYYGNFQNPPSLNGLAYLDRLSPGDYQAVTWLNRNITGQPVILEAVGESYTGFARISANTGLPAVFGWPVHEWLWRSSNHFADERRPDVEQIYTLKDSDETVTLLEKYQVKYVIIGDLERSKYQVTEEKFSRIGKPVFTWNQTRIYQISD